MRERIVQFDVAEMDLDGILNGLENTNVRNMSHAGGNLETRRKQSQAWKQPESHMLVQRFLWLYQSATVENV